MSFIQRLATLSRERESLVCVGLDPEVDRMPPRLRKLPPAQAVREFCLQTIEATHDLAAAYKPNSAFFEALGAPGMQALEEVVREAQKHAPVVLDAKRGDLGNTARMYARWAFDIVGADAVTVNPYMGGDSLEPFLEHRHKGVFVLCRTSNAGGKDFQDAQCEGAPLYERVARKCAEWNRHGNLGLVVGATMPEQLARVRAIAGSDVPFLVPGVGAQGGSVRDVLAHGANARGESVLVNASRSILYAGGASLGEQRVACLELRDEINAHRRKLARADKP